MSLCNFGIFGTQFVRDNQVETIVELPAGEKHSLNVKHIKAEYPYANDLAINLRQRPGSELSFVSFENNAVSASTNVIIDTTGLTTGEHTMVLQSFDENSDGVESTLKTDTIQIIIIEPEQGGEPVVFGEVEIFYADPLLPYFTEVLELAVIYSGTKGSWTLPNIDPGYSPLTSI